jgi:hypothetical protein
MEKIQRVWGAINQANVIKFAMVCTIPLHLLFTKSSLNMAAVNVASQKKL